MKVALQLLKSQLESSRPLSPFLKRVRRRNKIGERIKSSQESLRLLEISIADDLDMRLILKEVSLEKQVILRRQWLPQIDNQLPHLVVYLLNLMPSVIRLKKSNKMKQLI